MHMVRISNPGHQLLDGGLWQWREDGARYVKIGAAHLKAFMAVVKAGSAFASTVKDENFAAFAKSCNGPAYYDNNNDGKMKINFKKFEKADAATKEAK
ncbi:DUF3380 domain-containing protein [Burkholderia glumae]|nr:DUF3380 domain-containing protein [Burkholderia glumae]QGA38974.1 DUF3380 domain-containing protein [Burkholderia glumae]UVS89134.1 DUF3380 domain-containing protein [Burkholderia glumae]UVT00640.1 DUF3380 domain-containing protein [Burkholderia glumae]